MRPFDRLRVVLRKVEGRAHSLSCASITARGWGHAPARGDGAPRDMKNVDPRLWAMPKSRILVIDDEAAIRDSLRMTLEYAGYEFVGAATGQEGLAVAERETPDIVLLDIKMPGMDGMEVLSRLRQMNETTPVVMISGHGTTSTAVEAIKRGRSEERREGKASRARSEKWT